VLGPQDVGHRVVVRRIVGIRDNRPLYSDLLGVLTVFDDDSLTVATSKGEVRVPIATVVAGKRVPPPPTRPQRTPPPGR
jgi:N-acetylglutamate synthase